MFPRVIQSLPALPVFVKMSTIIYRPGITEVGTSGVLNTAFFVAKLYYEQHKLLLPKGLLLAKLVQQALLFVESKNIVPVVQSSKCLEVSLMRKVNRHII